MSNALSFYQQQLSALADFPVRYPLDHVTRGVEKENLRVDEHGKYVQTSHPQALGSSLTCPVVTTDFSESLLECITRPQRTRHALFAELGSITSWVSCVLSKQPNAEYLWPYSMPYLLGADDAKAVPIAQYGNSNVGRMKQAYRQGLVYRYGKAMQVIAGLHYNIAFPHHLIYFLGEYDQSGSEQDIQTVVSERYMGLIRNFIRHQWIIAYLFGCSPACFAGSLGGGGMPAYLKQHPADVFSGDAVTSLRLGDLGYHNNNQSDVSVSYDSVDSYARDLLLATQQPDARYKNAPVKDVDGHYSQLNRNLLQIENEYYVNIRPKPNPALSSNKRPGVALSDHGVEYIELRGLDLNPLSPLGLTAETSAFCDLFLFYLMLCPSPLLSSSDKATASDNLACAVESGRASTAQICVDEATMPLTDALLPHFDAMQPLAVWMDGADSESNGCYSKALAAQLSVVRGEKPSLSQELAKQWQDSRLPFKEYLLSLQHQHADFLASNKPEGEAYSTWEQLARASIKETRDLDSAEQGAFEDYLAGYFKQKVSEKK